ncbi:MAG: hypothetical protein IPH76_17935 [Xanthomonadales bacterium]|nr:hypothetical protein [Xanthomonadales bacterium]
MRPRFVAHQWQGNLLLSHGDLAGGLAALERAGYALEGPNIPAVLMLLGEHELALDYVERLAGELGGIADWAIMLPALDPIRCQFKALVAKLKTSDPHAARVCARRRSSRAPISGRKSEPA